MNNKDRILENLTTEIKLCSSTEEAVEYLCSVLYVTVGVLNEMNSPKWTEGFLKELIKEPTTMFNAVPLEEH